LLSLSARVPSTNLRRAKLGTSPLFWTWACPHWIVSCFLGLFANSYVPYRNAKWIIGPHCDLAAQQMMFTATDWRN